MQQGGDGRTRENVQALGPIYLRRQTICGRGNVQLPLRFRLDFMCPHPSPLILIDDEQNVHTHIYIYSYMTSEPRSMQVHAWIQINVYCNSRLSLSRVIFLYE